MTEATHGISDHTQIARIQAEVQAHNRDVIQVLTTLNNVPRDNFVYAVSIRHLV